MNKRITLTLASTAIAIAGCSFKPETTRMALDHNEFVAQTTNNQTLLNILRARDREPMHFTSFGKVAGSVKGVGSLKLGVAANGNFGNTVVTGQTVTKRSPIDITGLDRTETAANTTNRGADNFTPEASVQVTTGTDFDIAINADDEFYRGILGTISSNVVIHFLRQGFPSDLLSHLVIRKIEYSAIVKSKDGKILKDGNEELVGVVPFKNVTNAPDESENAKSFATIMKCVSLGHKLVARDPRSIRIRDPSALSGLTPELAGKLSETTADSKTNKYSYEIQGGSELAITLSVSDPDLCSDATLLLQNSLKESEYFVSYTAAKLPVGRSRLPVNVTASRSKTGGPENVSGLLNGSGGESLELVGWFNDRLNPSYGKLGYTADLRIDLSFRSVESILYYLGEYVRDDKTRPLVSDSRCRSGKEQSIAAAKDKYPAESEEVAKAKEINCNTIPILVVKPASEVNEAERIATVSYRGKRYSIPLSGSQVETQHGRSSQTIGLIQQLFNLHRKAKDLPTTPTVRVAN